jgi:hypothetical protein
MSDRKDRDGVYLSKLPIARISGKTAPMKLVRASAHKSECNE